MVNKIECRNDISSVARYCRRAVNFGGTVFHNAKHIESRAIDSAPEGHHGAETPTGAGELPTWSRDRSTANKQALSRRGASG